MVGVKELYDGLEYRKQREEDFKKYIIAELEKIDASSVRLTKDQLTELIAKLRNDDNINEDVARKIAHTLPEHLLRLPASPAPQPTQPSRAPQPTQTQPSRAPQPAPPAQQPVHQPSRAPQPTQTQPAPPAQPAQPGQTWYHQWQAQPQNAQNFPEVWVQQYQAEQERAQNPSRFQRLMGNRPMRWEQPANEVQVAPEVPLARIEPQNVHNSWFNPSGPLPQATARPVAKAVPISSNPYAPKDHPDYNFAPLIQTAENGIQEEEAKRKNNSGKGLWADNQGNYPFGGRIKTKRVKRKTKTRRR